MMGIPQRSYIIADVLETAIQAFIQDTGVSSRAMIVEPDASMQPAKKRYKRSTNIINWLLFGDTNVCTTPTGELDW